MKKTALFLDRDGIINQMVAYPTNEPFDSPQKPEDVILVDGIIDIIKWANINNILVFEITNQPGVAKGKLTQEQADNIESHIHQLLNLNNAKIDHIFTCPHVANDNCNCRKPKPGLLLEAAKKFNIDLTMSIMLGDSATDVSAGNAASCKTIILIHNRNLPQKVFDAKNAPADFKVNTLFDVIPILEKFFSPVPASP